MTPHASMNDRRDHELYNLVSFLQDAHAHGAHVFTPQELGKLGPQDPTQGVPVRQRPHRENSAQSELDLNNLDMSHLKGILPGLSLQEVLYHYQGADYQCIFAGAGIYHHKLLDGIHGTKPYRREPPTPAPWMNAPSQPHAQAVSEHQA